MHDDSTTTSTTNGKGAADLLLRPAMATDTDARSEPGAVWIGEVDQERLSTMGRVRLAGSRGHRRARLLVRRGRLPLGFVELGVSEGEVDGAELSRAVRALPDQVPCPPVGAPRPPVSVVLCTRDRPEQLRVAVESLLDQEYPTFEVVVVDNAPATAATADLIRELADPRLRHVTEPRPGLAIARNRGIGEAVHELIAFCDDDVVVDQWWLTGLADGFARGSDVACVTGLVPTGELNSLAQRYFDSRVSWAASCRPVVHSLDRPPADSPLFPFQVGQFGTGANFAMTRTALVEVGGFDEALGAGSPARGGEDIDMFVRVLLAGHELCHEPSALVWHRHRQELDQLTQQVWDYGAGLGAWLTKLAVHPRTALMVSRRSVGALAHARTVSQVEMSTENEEERVSVRQLASVERRGMMAGPLGYARSRSGGRRAAPLTVTTGPRRGRLLRASLKERVQRYGELPPAPGFRPTCVLVLDAEEPARAYHPGTTGDGRPYEQALVLLRRAGRPVADVTVPLSGGQLSRADVVTLLRDMPALPDGDSAGSPTPGGLVSVVIPTCRRPEQILTCVRSVLASDHPNFEVIVVDNAPQDPRTAELFADVFGQEPRVTYLQEPRAGASRARNTGARAARGEVIAFTDDDVTVDPGWLGALAAPLWAEPELGCATGLVLPLHLDTMVHGWFEQYGGFNRGYRRRRYDLTEHRGDTLLYPWTAGALGALNNVAFRRDALDLPEPFDVRLGPGTPAFGAEDQDVMVRLLRSGRSICYEPAALVRHDHRNSYEDLRWQVFTYGAGQTAAFTHWATGDRAAAAELCRRVPFVLLTLLRTRLTKGPGVQVASGEVDSCPPELRRLEWLGYLYGPVAYGRSRLAHAVAGLRAAR